MQQRREGRGARREVVGVLVREAMTVPVVTVLDDDEVAHAARTLLHHRVSSVPVLDADGHLVGMVSESDLLRERLGSDPRSHEMDRDGDSGDGGAPPRTVAEVMTTRPLTVEPGADLSTAAALLLDHGIHAAPVCDGRRLVGILARRDVLRTVAHPDDDVRAAALARLAEDLPGQPWRVEVEDGVVTLDGVHDPGQRRIAAVLLRTVPGVVHVSGVDAHVSIDQPVARPRP
ncbi:CBS domain-containing protein [Kineococcus sp. SYSU DK005]|uniref:CBS domain-containing protein n=1 Tax=Kineococcus sp. SYSU DK005 TaxID=3383126 RepID=UPI003D7D5ABF